MPRKPRFGRIYKPWVKRPDGRRIEVKTFWIAYYVRGQQIRESSKSTRYSDAEALLRKRLAEIEVGTYAAQAKRVTVSMLLDSLLLDYEVNEKSISWAYYVDGHLRPFLGHMLASRVETAHLQKYVIERRRDGVVNTTVKNELALLRRAFNLAREQTPPLISRTSVFPKIKASPPRADFFEHADFLVLRSELPDYLRPVITFAYQTGCRKGEILSLLWEQVDLVARVVVLNPGETKNDEPRTIPLAGELYELLAFRRQIRNQKWPTCPWVFFRYGKRIKSFRDAWAEACKRVGLWNEETGKPTRVFHDLRRTAVRNLVRAGVPEKVVMEIGGWKTRTVFDRYNIVIERDLHDAAAKLERHLVEVETRADRANTGQTSDDRKIMPS